jgi:hypothetical protein
MEMLDEVERLEKANIVNDPVGLTHGEIWIMELGKVTKPEKEAVFIIIGHEIVRIGKKKAIVLLMFEDVVTWKAVSEDHKLQKLRGIERFSQRREN